MKGGMIIKEILACIRGKEAFPREWEAGKRGKHYGQGHKRQTVKRAADNK